nr:MAG TPA: hypothetical protein [Caudoviricetes sp.]
MIYKDCGVGYKENGRESYLYLQEVNDNDVALLEYLGYRPLDCNRGRLVDEPETETWVKYIDEELESRLIRSLLSTITCDEMTEEQKGLVTEYQTEIWKAKINELTVIYKVNITEDQIHNWWLDYEFTDETERNLIEYIKNK